MALYGERLHEENSGSPGLDPVTVRVEDEFAFYSVRTAALNRASHLGMDSRDLAELDIVVRELVTNIVTHGGKHGFVTISHVIEGAISSLVLDVVDHGPGFDNFDSALLDGVSSTGSMGGGLPSVRRFAQHIELVRSGPGGSHLRVVKRASFQSDNHEDWVFALYTRPHPGEIDCGDQGTMIRNPEGILLILADGLGHGTHASSAAMRVVEIAHNNHRLHLPDLVKVIHAGLGGKSRGVALSLARIHPDGLTIDWLGLGNVSGGLLRPNGNGEVQQEVFANFNGTVGVQLGSYRTISYRSKPGDWLVMHTDGLLQSWADGFSEIQPRTPHVIGRDIIRTSSRKSDDSAILIGRARHE